MSSVTLKSQRPVGRGVIEYTYRCNCEHSSQLDVVITTSFAGQAQWLAELECQSRCGEALAEPDSYAQGLLELAKIQVPPPVFYAWVNHTDDANYYVTLCSGGIITIPKYMVKSLRVMGSSLHESGSATNVVTRIEFDPEKEGVLTVIQLAEALERALRVRRGSPAPSFTVPHEEHVGAKLSVRGVTCRDNIWAYNSAYPITGYFITKIEGCLVTSSRMNGSQQIMFVFIAPYGMQCGFDFSGMIEIDVAIRKP